MADFAVGPGCCVVCEGQVVVEGWVHVLQGPEGGGGGFAGLGQGRDVGAEGGGDRGKVAGCDVLQLVAVEAAAETVGEVGVEEGGYGCVGHFEGEDASEG